jgi:hypothetical protein
VGAGDVLSGPATRACVIAQFEVRHLLDLGILCIFRQKFVHDLDLDSPEDVLQKLHSQQSPHIL